VFKTVQRSAASQRHLGGFIGLISAAVQLPRAGPKTACEFSPIPPAVIWQSSNGHEDDSESGAWSKEERKMVMPLNLLRDISVKILPWTIEQVEDIEKVRQLRDSGHTAAFVSSPGSLQPYARVLALTPKGRAALLSFSEKAEALN
jgi:hypothetical protein